MSDDGRLAITGSADGTVRRWDISSIGAESRIIHKAKSTFDLALSINGLVAISDEEGIYLGDVEAKETFRVLEHVDPKKSVCGDARLIVAGNSHIAFSNDGCDLFSDGIYGVLIKWDVGTGARVARSKGLFFSAEIRIAAAAGRIVVAGRAQIGFWSEDVSQPVRLFKEDVAPQCPIAVTRDGVFAFTGTAGNQVVKWNVVEGRREAVFEGHSWPVVAVAVTPDGRFCASGDADGVIILWAVDTGERLAVLLGHGTPATLSEPEPPGEVHGSHDIPHGLFEGIHRLAISADGRRIVSVGDDVTLRIWDIPEWVLAGADAAPKRGYMNAKVVLVGDSGVGKSGLALRLWHDRWEKTETTHGMEIQRLTLPEASGPEDGVEREIWLWDLAGQPDYRLTHQLFMEQTALALLVFDPQDPEIFTTLQYWQNALKKLNPTHPVVGVLVAGRCDRPGLRLTLKEVEAWAGARGLEGPVLTAAKLKTHAGAKQLRELIAKLLPWDKLEFRATQENFPAIKDAILAVRDLPGAAVVVEPAELEARIRQAVPKLAFTAGDLRAVVGLLAGEGVLHRLPYGELIVLQPSWVNCYASTLVKLAGEAENQLGHVPLAVIQPGELPRDETPRLGLDDERKLLPALVALFLNRALAWKQATDQGEMLVFPNYVRLPRPAPPERPGQTVVYRFTGPHEAIYSTLVVRLHYSGLFPKDRVTLYRQAADFTTITGKLAALTLRETPEGGELEIHFGAGLGDDLQAAFQRFVHDHLAAKAATMKRLRAYICPVCGELIDRRSIDHALARKRTKVICSLCDPDGRPGVIELHDVLERQFDSDAGQARAAEAARQAAEEITSASKEGVMVGEVSVIVFGTDQIYRTSPQPDEGIDGEIEFRNAKRKASGLGYRVQLKSGDSHLKGTERQETFGLKPHYEDLWAGPGVVPVLLIIRSSKGHLRYIDATAVIRAAQKAAPDKPVKRIPFDGQDFNAGAVRRLRKERLGE